MRRRDPAGDIVVAGQVETEAVVVTAIVIAPATATAGRALFYGSNDGRGSWKIDAIAEIHDSKKATMFGCV